MEIEMSVYFLWLNTKLQEGVDENVYVAIIHDTERSFPTISIQPVW